MRRLRQAVSDNPTWDDILNSEAKAREDTGKVTREQAETDAIHRAIGIFGSYFRVDIPKDASLTVKQGKIVSQISPHETKVNTWQLSIASGRGIKSLPAFVPDPNDKPYEVLGIKLEDGSLELYFGTRQFAALGSDLLHTVHEVVRDRDSRWSDTILRIMQTQREGLSWAGRKYSDSLIVTGSGETIEISPAYSPEDCEPRIMYKAVVSKV
ncbi:hypothetical protein I302_104015 [Kwoniella bestiolae CBS 10118]|uniref:Uncharacterized protein n=1 Tax=Kwoniella bestiolae CBS 10118 TaxID=1296100 RepID=A0A1B9GA49_9TREE|nr:hypothetical protein I302_02720 [Kwoniella bestiolae CBS 10118]OCF27870.1 hypothetical protein I302_02720 [Kwoniella bestiolae CBS 10118]